MAGVNPRPSEPRPSEPGPDEKRDCDDDAGAALRRRDDDTAEAKAPVRRPAVPGSADRETGAKGARKGGRYVP
jgi:hypothetical protein